MVERDPPQGLPRVGVADSLQRRRGRDPRDEFLVLGSRAHSLGRISSVGRVGLGFGSRGRAQDQGQTPEDLHQGLRTLVSSGQLQHHCELQVSVFAYA